MAGVSALVAGRIMGHSLGGVVVVLVAAFSRDVLGPRLARAR